MNKIASGAEGNVYVLQNKKILKHRKINTDDKEYKIQHILYEIVPKSIIRPIDQFRTLNGNPMFLMDYLNAKSFKELILNPDSFDNFPNIMLDIVCKVMKTLDKIHHKYPSFRHNDLHGDNVMITPDQDVYIIDFGKSRMDLEGVNHMSVYEEFGIVPLNDIRYDYHLFINTVYLHAPPKIRKIIEMVIPLEYLQFESDVVQNFRLRSEINHKNLPSRKKKKKIFCVKYNK
jgi:tRNA A-37 threonylcarbamoyl transferase component Bud32